MEENWVAKLERDRPQIFTAIYDPACLQLRTSRKPCMVRCIQDLQTAIIQSSSMEIGPWHEQFESINL